MTSNPDGVAAFVDGEPKGMTPVTLTLPAGPHVVELRGSGEPRTIPVTITAGTQATQYIELPKTAAKTGQLQIRTEPSGARVTVDGIPRGTSPITVVELDARRARRGPGKRPRIRQGIGDRRIGVTASLVVPLRARRRERAVSGWISVSAPLDVQVFEEGRLIGNNLSDRIMVSAGRHTSRSSTRRSVPLRPAAPGDGRQGRRRQAGDAEGDHLGQRAALGRSVDRRRAHRRDPDRQPPGSDWHAQRAVPPSGIRRTASQALVTLKGPTRLSVDMRKRQ